MSGGRRRVLTVRVKPRSSRAGVEADGSGGLTVSVHAPADRGRANEEAVRLLASHLGVPSSAVRILRGAASRVKRVEITDERL